MSRAVVIGGSVAGMCAARVLCDFYDEVVLLDRDHYPAQVGHRAGVPQSRHAHALLVRGQRELEQLFPGFVARGVEVATGDNRWTEPVKIDPQPVEATGGTDPQATTDEASAQTDPATLSKRAARLQWQTDGVTGGPDPQTLAAGPTARPDPATASKRSARMQWD